MTIEIIDVVDSAVKIGLGALISGVATYTVTKLNHRNDVKKYVLNKKFETVEKIASLTENYFFSFTAQLSFVLGIIPSKRLKLDMN